MNRILVVDDDGHAVDGLRRLLELDGYSVIALRSASEALARLGEERFDVFLTDLEMPDHGGLELIAAARAGHPNMPVFVMSGHFGTPTCDDALARGAKLAFAKPVDYDALVRELAKVLE